MRCINALAPPTSKNYYLTHLEQKIDFAIYFQGVSSFIISMI